MRHKIVSSGCVVLCEKEKKRKKRKEKKVEKKARKVVEVSSDFQKRKFIRKYKHMRTTLTENFSKLIGSDSILGEKLLNLHSNILSNLESCCTMNSSCFI